MSAVEDEDVIGARVEAVMTIGRRRISFGIKAHAERGDKSIPVVFFFLHHLGGKIKNGKTLALLSKSRFLKKSRTWSSPRRM